MTVDKNGLHMGIMSSVRLGEDEMSDRRSSLLLGCNACGYWTGWVSKTIKKAYRQTPRTIDTICSVCHSRIRFTRGSMSKKGTPIGSGGHQYRKSVFAWKTWNDPSTCKSEAARINRHLKLTQMDLAERGYLGDGRKNPHEFN